APAARPTPQVAAAAAPASTKGPEPAPQRPPVAPPAAPPAAEPESAGPEAVPPPPPPPPARARPKTARVQHGKPVAAPAVAPSAQKEAAPPPRRPGEMAFREGQEAFDQGRSQDAIPKFLEAVRLDPGYAEAYRALGKAYQRVAQPETGKTYYR